MINILYMFLVVALVSVLVFVAGQYWYVNNKIEKPTYAIISTHDEYEVRAYQPYIIASAQVPDTEQAMNNGFRLVADYIFGNNTKAGVAEPIAMTAPVLDQATQNEPIAMTTPVLDEPAGQGLRTVSFVMPSSYIIDTLPTPNNNRVTITEVPAEVRAVYTYSGLTSREKKTQNYKKFVSLLDRDGVQYTSEWSSASYDPPSTLPFLRTHEIWITLER